MLYKETTAAEAVKHFEEHVFPSMFVGARNKDNKEYHRVFRIIQAAKSGDVSDTRAKWLLETYGCGRYKCSSVFEVEAGSNGTAFGEAARNFGEELNESNTTI